MHELYMINGDGFIVVYSISDIRSLMNAGNIFQNLVRIRKKYHASNFSFSFFIM